MKVLYLGAGEFWLPEAVYRQAKGVIEVVPGYMGGEEPYPTDEHVASGMTGHAEVVKVTYDENCIATEDILSIFYALHDPATPSHPAKGIGSQYRPVIFYTEEGEAEASNPENGKAVGTIRKAVEAVQSTLPEGAVISTAIMSAMPFYPADERHYNYYTRHADDAYVTTVIAPKLQEVREKFYQFF